MCGITGVIETAGRSVSQQDLQMMVNAIEHRGPDGQGLWLEGNVGLGHTRLAIIDLSDAGIQPMHSGCGRYILSYNGEIYNFKEIKRELTALGHRFKSHTDTEVVLNSLIEWGDKAVLKFNGMFALAMWDRKRKSLLLARDRYGIKPLYYAIQNGKIYFGSEQKAIYSHPHFQKKINNPGLLEYFTFQNFFSDQTLLEDIKTFPAGSTALITDGSNSLNFDNYWDYDFKDSHEIKEYREYEEELTRLFSNAVERQLTSDVEIGSYLSGGIDSGAITAIAASKLPNLKTFTCGFDVTNANDIEILFDERGRAESMSSFCQTEQYEMVLKSGDMERCLPKLAYHLEEPRVGQSYPNYYAANLASKFVKVVLSGTGGDELFGGYPWRYFAAADNKSFDNYIDDYYLYWQRLLSNSELRKLFSPIWSSTKDIWTRDIFREVFKYKPRRIGEVRDNINHSLYFEAKTFLHGLLIVEDKLSMAHGLESRVPFLDNDLVDFAMSVPVEYKLNRFDTNYRINENEVGNKKRRYFQKTNNGKYILRSAMSNILPKDVISRSKQGFSAPDATWFAKNSRGFVSDTILSKNALINEIFDPKIVRNLCEEHFTEKKNRRLLIWSLLNIEALLQKM